MKQSPFAGVWRYRSFLNLPESVDTFDKLRFAEAELTLSDNGPGLLQGRLKFGQLGLRIMGNYWRSDGQYNLRMTGSGEDGTDTEGWIYDYIGYLNPTWPLGDGQRPTIVGTLMRTVPHRPDRKAGITVSFIAVNIELPPEPYRLPDLVVKHFAARPHRLHHSVWHGVRNSWPLLTDTQRTKITTLYWNPPRVAKEYVNNAPWRPNILNGSGEDFLFFHRDMVAMYRELMQQANTVPIVWVEIPQPGPGAPGDEVPPAWSIPGAEPFERRIAALKMDIHYWSCMRWWDQRFKDPVYLSTLTLGELGSLMEFSVHNDMHMRWSALARDPQTRIPLPLGRQSSDFSSKWDDPAYDFLGEFYSSHVNPIFWRLHGWIDDRINDWYQAHESKHPGQVKPAKLGSIDWFATGSWVQVDKPWVIPDAYQSGGHHGGHGGSNPDDLLKSLEKVAAILYPSESSTLIEKLASERAPAITSLVGW